jgi:glycine cleavage system regulatory protein
MSQLVITIVGEDRPGIVESLAATVADHGGNWLSSSMSNLAGQFAGIIQVTVMDDRSDDLAAAIGRIEGLHVHSVLGRVTADATTVPVAAIEIVGVDQPGIVRRLTGLLRDAGINLLEFASWTEPAPNSGDQLFRALAEFVLDDSIDQEALGGRLEELAEELGLDIELGTDSDDED